MGRGFDKGKYERKFIRLYLRASSTRTEFLVKAESASVYFGLGCITILGVKAEFVLAVLSPEVSNSIKIISAVTLPQYYHSYSLHCSPNISYFAGWENFSKH